MHAHTATALGLHGAMSAAAVRALTITRACTHVHDITSVLSHAHGLCMCTRRGRTRTWLAGSLQGWCATHQPQHTRHPVDASIALVACSLCMLPNGEAYSVKRGQRFSHSRGQRCSHSRGLLQGAAQQGRGSWLEALVGLCAPWSSWRVAE